MNRGYTGTRRNKLAARIPLFSASVIASEQAYRIRFAFVFILDVTLEHAAWIPASTWFHRLGDFSPSDVLGGFSGLQ